MLTTCISQLWINYECTNLWAISFILSLQQEHVLSELKEYATAQPPPPDAGSVLETVDYLQACNSIFERGILGKGVFIKTMDNPILRNIASGYQYFTEWLDRKLEAGQWLCTKCICIIKVKLQ